MRFPAKNAASNAEAIADGAPDAVQIADRWRILKNLYEALERLLTRLSAWIK
jgi:hypothetical protein